MNKETDQYTDVDHFSLMMGGPLYKILHACHLLKKPFLFHKRRIVFFALLTWLPLFIFSMLNGEAFSGVSVPFIHDIEVHVRFLIVIAMLLYAEVIAHDRFHVIVAQFQKCNMIAVADKQKFNRMIKTAMHFRDSVVIEIILMILVYTLGHWVSVTYVPVGLSSWFSVNNGQLTPAGYWYMFISLPIFQFILLRWYFRITIWYGFLWKLSRLPLQLNSLHPDKAGGLGFLANSIYALEPFLLAHSVLLSGMIFNRIWNAGAVIADFKIEIVSILIFILMIPLMPLLFFMFQMVKEKRLGTLNYGVVANQYVNEFRQKWINASSAKQASILGASDIQSLADLFNSFEVSNNMRIVPFGKNSIMVLIVLTALPLLPLILTIIPLEKMISQIVGLIF